MFSTYTEEVFALDKQAFFNYVHLIEKIPTSILRNT